MLFNSIPFFIFFPIVVMLYFLIPQKFRYIWLLIASYYYYMFLNPKYVVFLIFSTIVTYFGGMIVQNASTTGKKKLAVAISVLLNLSMLLFFKYSNFISEIFSSICSAFGLSIAKTDFHLILPVGISFYTFQSLSYLIDSYRNEVKVEKNIFKYALFVSFFPNILAGPIERSKNLIKQFDERHTFDYARVRDGLLLMLWGYFQKVVIVARLSILTDMVYGDISSYSGTVLALATVCYGLEIYCDFASYSSIAIVAAKVMGFELMTNFKQPFFSRSTAEFWRRWHISLNTWFRDYLYIPMGGSRVSKFRKYVNLMIVFLASGLWHGDRLTYLLWGAANGLFQIIGDLLKPLRQKICSILHYDFSNWIGQFIKIAFTFFLFHVSLVFFCAGSVTEALTIFKKILTEIDLNIFLNGTLYQLGLGVMNFYLLLLSLIVLLIVDLFKEHTDALRFLSDRHWIIRWGIYYLLISATLLSCNLSTQEFLYMNF